MKKSSCLLLICVMILLSTIANAEGFTLRNGIQFGMNPEEVRAAERANGSNWDGNTDKVKVANQKANMVCSFKDESLYELEYKFDTNKNYSIVEQSYTAIEQLLVNKYGDAEYSSVTNIEIPPVYESSETTWSTVPYLSYKYRDMGFRTTEITRPYYSHRLIRISETEYVLIDHALHKIDESDFGINYWHHLRYILLAESQVNEIFENLKRIQSDI